MATYYVRQDGNDANTGLGSTGALAWKTLQKALGATGIGSGDTVYIAPGIYIEAVVIGGTYSAPTYIIGDPTASQFSGVSAGLVNHTSFNAAGTVILIGANLISGTSKSYLKFSYINWTHGLPNGYGAAGNTVVISGRYIEFTNCVFEQVYPYYTHIQLSALSGQAANAVISKCIFLRGAYGIELLAGSNQVDTSSISSCLFILTGQQVISITSTQTKIYNCTMLTSAQYSVVLYAGSATNKTSVYNNIIPGQLYVDVSNSMEENYNRLVGSRAGVIPVGSNSTNSGTTGIDIGQALLFGLPNSQMLTSGLISPNKSYGITANAPVTDLYGVAWTGTSPDAGAGTYKLIGGLGSYYPTERNATMITIVPGSTSQSIEMYLGVTGLTASTAGLTATYNRTRSNRVPITLVNLTYMTDSWVSGGFKEVDATTMPGVYRLDLPNDALNAGADDVTIVVRGAAGTNGAVMTIKLLSVASDILSADLGSGTNAGTLNERTVRSALRSLRNKVSVGSGTMTVYKENDVDTAWTGSLSNTSDVTVDPS